MAGAPSQSETRTIWDLSLRLFHWSLAISILLMWFTAEQGFMAWHRRIGLCVLALLVYRLYWGLAGPSTARFANLKIKPAQVFGYIPKLLIRPYHAEAGHNPLGSLSVIALLGAVTFQVTSGLFAIDVDGLESGPLATFISFDLGREIADLHELSFNVVQTLIILHLCAIAYYTFYLRAKLVSTMITGKRKGTPDDTPEVKAGLGRTLLGLALAGLTVTAVNYFGN